MDQALHIVQAYRENPIDAAAALFCVFLALGMCTSFGRRMLLRPFRYLLGPLSVLSLMNGVRDGSAQWTTGAIASH